MLPAPPGSASKQGSGLEFGKEADGSSGCWARVAWGALRGSGQARGSPVPTPVLGGSLPPASPLGAGVPQLCSHGEAPTARSPS